MKKRIVVTGGLGFIGLHLTRRLLEAGHVVTVLDNCSAGTVDRHAQDLQDRYRETLQIRRHDFTQPLQMLQNLDEIYHLAAAIGTKELIKDPSYMVKTNIMLMIRALELAKEKQAKLLYTSTAEVATGMGRGEVNEDIPIGWEHNDPRWLYSFSKYAAEQLLRFSGLPHTIVRLGNVYGPRMCHDYVVKAFITRLQGGENPFHVKSADDTRPFCYVTDIVDGLINAMETREADGQTILLAAKGATSIGDLARTISRLMQNETDFIFEKGTSETRLYNTTKAKQLLDWEARVPLTEGLTETIAYYQHHENA